MSESKTKYNRAELIYVEEDYSGFVENVCALCQGTGPSWEDKIDHEDNCVLADPDVTGIWISACSDPREDICSSCDATKEECPAINGWGNETHRHLLVICGLYRSESK